MTDSSQRLRSPLLDRETLAAVVDGAGLGVFTVEARSGRVRMSERCRSLVGLASGSGRDLAAILAAIHPDDRARVRAEAERALTAPAGSRVEFRVATPTGPRWLAAAGRGERRTPAGRPQRFAGVLYEIGVERLGSEVAALQLIDQRFRLLAEQAPIGIILRDAERRLTYANPAWLEIAGRPLAAVLGDGWRAVIHPDDLPRWRTMADESEAARRPVHGELRYLRPNGEVRWIDGRGTPLLGQGGELLGHVITALDITERRAMAEEMSRSHRQVRALAQRLAHAQADAREELSRRMHEGIAQELSAVRFGLEALTRGADDAEETRRRAAALGAEVATTLEVVRQLAVDLRPPALDTLGLEAVVREHASELGSRSGLKVQIRTAGPVERLAPKHAEILYRVSQEALSNVLQHARAQGVTIEIEVDSERARLVVCDDGCGIAPGDRDKHDCLGLLGLRERLDSVRGLLAVSRAEPCGTRVEASIPQSAPRSRRRAPAR